MALPSRQTERRQVDDAVQTSQWVHQTKVNTSERLVTPTRMTRGMHACCCQVPFCRCELRRQSFFTKTIRDWNALPADVTSAESLEVFKALLTA